MLRAIAYHRSGIVQPFDSVVYMYRVSEGMSIEGCTGAVYVHVRRYMFVMKTIQL